MDLLAVWKEFRARFVIRLLSLSEFVIDGQMFVENRKQNYECKHPPNYSGQREDSQVKTKAY